MQNAGSWALSSEIFIQGTWVGARALHFKHAPQVLLLQGILRTTY